MRRLGAALAFVSLVASALPACTTTANISDVYMALDGDGNRKRNIFFTDTQSIHCVVEAGIGRDGATVEVIIRQVQRFDLDNGKTFDSDRVVTSVETSPARADGVTKLDVILDKVALAQFDGVKVPITDPDNPPPVPVEDPFPVGRFVCEVRLEGDLKGQATFNIQIPPCPTAVITPNTACYGFYPEGQQCKRYGDSSAENDSCDCDKQKGWQCQ